MTRTMTTSPVGWPQKTNIRANSATAPIRSPLRCAYVHSPTGPVTLPAVYDIRLSRCSPTRMALAMAVRAGFTAPMLGKKLVSTT